jgi:hypothetical protein
MSSGRTTPVLALSQALEHVEGGGVEGFYSPGLTTHVLALAKPPSVSMGRV